MAAPVTQNYGPGNVDELLTTSLVNMRPGIKDNFFKSNPLFNFFYQGKGNSKIKTSGGVALSHGIMYDKNSTAQSYQRYDTLNTTPQDGLTRDQWTWAQYAAVVTIDGFSERVANSGDSKLEDILATKKMQAEQSLQLLLEQHMFQSTPGSKDLRSLATIVNSSGTEGGISGTTSSWWTSTVTASGSFAGQGRADLTNAWNAISVLNPTGGPDVIASDQNSYQYYETSLVPQERFTDNKLVDIGIQNLKFKTTPWIWSPQATSGVIYLLTTDGIEFTVNSDTDFMVTPFVTPTNQDARSSKILLACALDSGNRRKLAKLTGVTA